MSLLSFRETKIDVLQLAGGPEIKLRFGRKDADAPEGCAPEGNLPGNQSAPRSLHSL